jgi:hypothetical protein
MRRAACALTLALSACDPSSFGNLPTPADAGKSPDASVAVPLEDLDPSDGGAVAAKTLKDAGADAANDAAPPPPEPFDAYEVLAVERPRARELTGVVMEGRWLWRDLPAAVAVPQANRSAIEAAHKASDGRWTITLTGNGRMRLDVQSKAQPLPVGTAVLARASRYGHALVWPDGRRYRLVAPGSMRTVLSEQRVDVSPWARSTVTKLETGNRLEREVTRTELRSAVGVVVLEQAQILEAGAAAPLVCRFFVELVGVDPAIDVCRDGGVTLAATFRWTQGDQDSAGIRFEVESVSKRQDLPANPMLLPPPRAVLSQSGLPQAPGGLFFDADELAAFRTEGSAEPNPPDPRAPEQGIAAENRSDMPMWLLLEAVPVAVVAPWQTVVVPGPRAGRYSVQWRSFMGEVVGEAAERDLPARVWFGQPPNDAQADAGAQP